MIVLAVFRLMGAVAFGLLGLLPSFGFDASSATAAVNGWTFFGYFGWVNHYMPLDLGLVLLGVRLTLWGAMHAVEAVVWLLTKAHVLGGSS